MTEVKDQKIVVLCELLPSDKDLILNGIKIAAVFKKELCLVYNYSRRKKKNHLKYREELQNYVVPIKNELPRLIVSTLLLTETWTNLPDTLAIDYEGIVTVANANRVKRYSKLVSESSIPILFVRPGSKILGFNHLVQPIDLRKENSDSSLWSSYFGRFNNAKVVVVAANAKSKHNKRAIARNLELTTKLYRKFKIVHTAYKGAKSSFQNSFEALDLALASDCNLFVFLGSRVITPLDLLIGLPEQRIIERAGNLPVLLINPRKDNYILCD